MVPNSDSAVVEHVRSVYDQEGLAEGVSKFEAEFVDYHDTEGELRLPFVDDKFDTAMMVAEGCEKTSHRHRNHHSRPTHHSGPLVAGRALDQKSNSTKNEAAPKLTPTAHHQSRASAVPTVQSLTEAVRSEFYSTPRHPPCNLCSHEEKSCKPIAVDASNNTRICKRCWRLHRVCSFDQTPTNRSTKTGSKGDASLCDTCRRGGAKPRSCNPILMLSVVETNEPLRCESC